MRTLLETVAAELERPRELSSRVVNYISGTYDVDHDAIGSFLVDRLPKLEDYEVDLILSPVFTPKLADQAVFAELLGCDSIPQGQWQALIQELAARPTCAQLVTADGRSHAVPLREVTIERYVDRLRLDGTIPQSIFNLIERTPPSGDRPLLKAIARRAIWDTGERRSVLERYLSAAAGCEDYRLTDAIELLNLLESYKPARLADLLALIQRMQQVLREQINLASSPKAFLNREIEAMHGGTRDQRRQDDARIAAKQDELALLSRLQSVLEGRRLEGGDS
jgi:hypothetical protein